MKAKQTSARDAYGHGVWDDHNGNHITEIVERDDGYIGTSAGPGMYFREYKDWQKHEKQGIKYARGRVLDIGAGAGRVALYLQDHGCQVTAIDISPLAVRACRARGVKTARVLPIEQIHSLKSGSFDSVVMYGNNMGLLAGFKKARRLLRTLYRITTDDARIIGGSTDPYDVKDPVHLAYQRRNRKRGRMSGQLRIRVRYQAYVGTWFNWLLISKKELEEILKGTGWKVERYIDSDGPSYIAVLNKD